MNNRNFVYAILMLVQLIFALNFVTTKMIVGIVNPVWWAFLRFFISSMFVIFIGFFTHKVHCNKEKSYYPQIIILAFFGIALSQISFLKGIKLTTSINSAIICSTIPLFTLLILFIRGEQKPNIKNISGIILAILGVLFIRNFEEFKITNQTFIGDLLVLLNAVSSAIYIVYSRDLLKTHSTWWVTARIFFAGSVMVFLWGIFEGAPMFVQDLSPKIIWSMVYGILAATLMSYLLINWALKRVDSGKVSFFIYLQPPLTSLMAYLFLGEPVTLRMVFSSFLILGGFLLTLNEKRLEV